MICCVFVKNLIHFIQGLEIFKTEQFLEVNKVSSKPYILWHGQRLSKPDWSDDSHCLAFSLCHPASGERLHVIFNAFWKPLEFELPSLKLGNSWHRIVDTSLPAPEDFADAATAKKIYANHYLAAARSSIVLLDQGGILPIPDFKL